jgi:hypothetical protein
MLIEFVVAFSPRIASTFRFFDELSELVRVVMVLVRLRVVA